MASGSSETGRRLVIGVAAIALAISAATIVGFNLAQGQERSGQQLVRFALTVALCLFLVRGRRWARWTSIVLFLLGGVGSIAGGLALLGQSAGAPVLLAMGSAYLACVGLLLIPGSVRAFFRGAGTSGAPDPPAGSQQASAGPQHEVR